MHRTKRYQAFATMLAMTSTAFATFTWSAPSAINTGAGTDVAHDTTPKLAVGPDGKIAAAWVSQTESSATSITETRRTDVKTAFSTDSGLTWSGEKILSDPRLSNGGLDLAPGDAGQYHYIWSSGDVFSEFQLHLANTANGGDSFTTETLTDPFTQREYGFVNPQIIKADETLVAAWSSFGVGNTQTLSEGGLYANFYHQSLSNGTWVNRGTPLSPYGFRSICYTGEVASDGGGNFIATTLRKPFVIGQYFQIYISTSPDYGKTWTIRGASTPDPLYVADHDVAAGGNGVWVLAYVDDPSVATPAVKRLLIQRSGNNGTTWTTPLAIEPPVGMADKLLTPSVASNGAGEWIVVLRAEQSDAAAGSYGTDGDIVYVRSTDNGVTWSPMEPVLDDAITDTVIDAAPQVEWLNNTKWGLTWSRTNGITTQGDIAWSTGKEPGAEIQSWVLYED